MPNEHETGPIPPGDYTVDDTPLPVGDYNIKPIEIVSRYTVKCRIMRGKYEGRLVFVSIRQLFPREMVAVVGIKAKSDGTLRNTFNFIKSRDRAPSTNIIEE